MNEDRGQTQSLGRRKERKSEAADRPMAGSHTLININLTYCLCRFYKISPKSHEFYLFARLNIFCKMAASSTFCFKMAAVDSERNV